MSSIRICLAIDMEIASGQMDPRIYTDIEDLHMMHLITYHCFLHERLKDPGNQAHIYLIFQLHK